MSLPCGNLVDGLPHGCHTETIAKQARGAPRTQIVLTMTKSFLTIISSTSVLGGPIIVSDNILKIRIEPRTKQQFNKMKKLYRLWRFEQVDIFGRNLENLETSEIIGK